MSAILLEFVKLKRSLSWAVVVVLPVTMVVAGSVSTAVSDGFSDGWHTLWIRSIGFYGMAVVSAGIAILASLVWRVEHRGGNWNALMSGTRPTWTVVAGKTAAVSILAAVMQLVLLLTVVVLGKVAFGLPGMLPGTYVATSLLIAVAQIPVAALQSLLSTFIRSFAVPVALALVLTGVGTMALLLKVPAAFLLPQALLTQTTQIGSRMQMTSFTVTDLSLASSATTVATSLVLAAAVIAITAAVLDRTDSRV